MQSMYVYAGMYCICIKKSWKTNKNGFLWDRRNWMARDRNGNETSLGIFLYHFDFQSWK